VLTLGTPYPLPHTIVDPFLQRADPILVVEETAPIVERAMRAEAQLLGCTASIYGRDTGHLPGAGELSAADIAQALRRLPAGLSSSVDQVGDRAMPSRRSLCEGCPYVPVFGALLSAVEQRGGRENAIIIGDPGCMVRAQLPPYELLDVKYSLGSSIGTAIGLSVGQKLVPEQLRHVIALCGDSGLLHSGLNALIDAAQLDATMLVIVLDNRVTALTGGQPHAGTGATLRGGTVPGVDLAELARAAGVRTTRVVESQDEEALGKAFSSALWQRGLSVVIARGACPEYRPGAGPPG
jgi:indolepyruvate ferredoxin oxidoreductase alpha subunit